MIAELLSDFNEFKDYYGLIKKKLTSGLNKEDESNPPSRIFKPEEIEIPPFLPQTEKVRLEMAAYYSTVRRADDSIGNVIQALKDTGVYDKTIIFFLSVRALDNT